MQFTSFEFIIFFPIVVVLFYIMPKRFRTFWLLLASYYFYMGWNSKYALLIFASTVVTYISGIILEKLGENKKKKILALCVCLAANLGILIFFKYFYFLHDTLSAVCGFFGFKIREARLDIALPVGISFYTFQALGYTIDVYRGNTPAEKNFIRYALFVSFFPQLVAGPIERSGNLIWQLERLGREKVWDFDKVTRGLLMILWGFFMKLVLADRAAAFVNSVFDVYYMCGGAVLFMGVFMFAVQVYCDFAGYSTIAAGAALVLGVELMPNFKAPFFSTSISGLWRRWHISLSSWFRDYVYIPLGGNRCSKARKYFNTMVTFLLSGLWHGASWHYVFWGGLNGAYIVIGDILRPIKRRISGSIGIRTGTLSFKFFQGVCTFCLFMLSFVFFRADTVRDGFYYIQRMVNEFDIWTFFDEGIYNFGLDRKEFWAFLVGMAVLIVVDAFYVVRKKFFDALIKEQCLAVQYAVTLALLVMVIVFGVYGEGYDASQFIYFQF